MNMNQKLARKPIVQLVNKILFNGKNNVSQNGGIPYLLFMHLNTRNKNINCKCKAVTINSFELWGHILIRSSWHKRWNAKNVRYRVLNRLQDAGTVNFSSSLKIIKQIPNNIYCRKSLRQVFLVPCNPNSVCSKTVQ